jgi:hypothetical protein
MASRSTLLRLLPLLPPPEISTEEPVVPVGAGSSALAAGSGTALLQEAAFVTCRINSSSSGVRGSERPAATGFYLH